MQSIDTGKQVIEYYKLWNKRFYKRFSHIFNFSHSSHFLPFADFLKIGVLKNFSNFTGNFHSYTGVFQWNLWNFTEHLFYRTPWLLLYFINIPCKITTYPPLRGWQYWPSFKQQTEIQIRSLDGNHYFLLIACIIAWRSFFNISCVNFNLE